VQETTVLVSDVCRYLFHLSFAWAEWPLSEYTWLRRPENTKGTRGEKEGSDLGKRT